MRIRFFVSIMLALAVVLCAGPPARAQGAGPVEKSNVTLMLDWTISGTHAPFFVAQAKGYFKDEGLTVKIDRGTGALSTATSVGSGVYDFGWADVPAMILFDAQNPGKNLSLVYISFDENAMAVIALAKSNIHSLKDLEGRSVGHAAGGASRATFNLLLKIGTPEEIHVNAKAISPQLREPLLIRGDVDALLGFTTSTIMTLRGLGIRKEDIVSMTYGQLGLDMYGTGLWARREFIDKNRRTVAAMVRALNRGTKDAIADPAGAIDIMLKVDPMLDRAIEIERLKIAIGHHLTPYVLKNGLSTVDPERMRGTIDIVMRSEQAASTPSVDAVWDGRFLPPREERMPPTPGQ